MAKLVRTLAGYAGCSADAIASGSKAQVMYFIDDAKADIATLADENERLRAELNECAEYFDRFSDADHDQDGFVPNEEMKMLSMIKLAMGEV